MPIGGVPNFFCSRGTSQSSTQPKAISHIHSHQNEIDGTGNQFDALHHIETSIKSPHRCPMIKHYRAGNQHQYSIGTNKRHSLLLLSYQLSASAFSQGEPARASECNGRNKNQQAWPDNEAFQGCDGFCATEKLNENGCRKERGNAQEGNNCGNAMKQGRHGFLRQGNW